MPPASLRPRPAPVSPPAFPPVDDDPFAPLPTTPNRPAAAAPTALSPHAGLADASPLGSDGRLLVREWTDNSGQFRVQGRLVLILAGKVRLLKETGRSTTVPVERLSEADRAYVTEVVARYGADLEQLDQLAAR
jgi:hypothetical protein